MIKLKDVHCDCSKYEDDIDLEKLTGMKIKSIKCYVSREFGEPTLAISGIILENDAMLHVEGEHDIAYLCSYGTSVPNMDEETLESLYREANGDDD